MELKYKAYWISPDSKIIGVGRSHIQIVMEMPELFGINEKMIRKCYRKYDEKYGFEGKARKKILIGIISQGWVRMRFYNKDYCWSITVNNENNPALRTAENIAKNKVNSLTKLTIIGNCTEL